jgi:hypothetical protein
MQNTTSLLLKTMTYSHPEEIPVFAGVLPAARKLHGEAMNRILRKYPAFFDLDAIERGVQQMAITYYAGEHTDPWGCVWSNLQEGMEAYVTGHPLPNREDIRTLKAPATDMGLPHGFMYLRLLDLRGFEEAMMDFAEEPEELETLVETVCAYNVRQTSLLVESNQNPILFYGDDLGMQQGLAIGAAKWRKWMKPAFKRIYDVAHAAGRKVYMHTDGDIVDIMPDLVEAGVDMINPQFRANGVERLEKTCKGKIPIMLDLDRQLFPFGSPADMRDHVRQTVERLYLPQGGLGLNIEIGMEVPLENVDALLAAANEMRTYRG